MYPCPTRGHMPIKFNYFFEGGTEGTSLGTQQGTHGQNTVFFFFFDGGEGTLIRTQQGLNKQLLKFFGGKYVICIT